MLDVFEAAELARPFASTQLPSCMLNSRGGPVDCYLLEAIFQSPVSAWLVSQSAESRDERSDIALHRGLGWPEGVFSRPPPACGCASGPGDTVISLFLWACYAELTERRKQVAQSVGQDSNQESDIAAILAPGEPGICHGTDIPTVFGTYRRLSGNGPERPEPLRSGVLQISQNERNDVLAHSNDLLVRPMLCNSTWRRQMSRSLLPFHGQAFELGLRICYVGAARQVKTDLFGTLPGSHAHDSSLANGGDPSTATERGTGL